MAAKMLSLEIDGMHCEACVRRVTAALERTGAGRVSEVRVGEARIEALPEAAATLVAALEKAGFTARVRV